jgi:hypothetical protein
MMSKSNYITLVYLSFFIAVSYGGFAGNNAAFTCQGDSYVQALNNCPDGGKQRFTMGGNVTVFVKSMKNLPDRDIHLSSGLSDPYVKFTVNQGRTAKSSYARDTLNPVWNEEVNLGVLQSGTEIKIQIYDADSGIEFFDDLLLTVQIRVPFCSMFNASETENYCDGQPFGCSVDDSSWAAPSRKMCHEYGVINFREDANCDDEKAQCLDVEFRIVPFQMEMELAVPKDNETHALIRSPEVSAACETYNDAAWTRENLFGYPYLSDQAKVFEHETSTFTKMEGALIFRWLEDDRATGDEDEILFYGSVNFPSYIYICRDVEDNDIGVPNWITEGYSARNKSIYQLKFNSPDTTFECYYSWHPGTSKNKWNGVIDNVIPFRSNTIAPFENRQNKFEYANNYFALAIPDMIDPEPLDLSIYYNAGAFIKTMFTHGLVLAFFLFMIIRFLKKINYRIDRIMTYLVTQVYTGENKSVVATLFLGIDGQSPNNIDFRSHLCHAKNVILFILCIPHTLIIAWGFSSITVLEPISLGYGIAFLGSAALFLLYGFALWEKRRWHMSPHVLISMIACALLFLCFLVSVIFADPAVYKYHFAMNFTALSLLFGCLNMFPLLLLVFHRDVAYKTNLAILVEKLTDTVYKIKEDEGVKVKRGNKPLSVNTVLHALLGPAYTVNPNVPIFQFATVLKNIGSSAKTAEDKEERSGFLTNMSLAILLIYFIIGVARTDYPSLVFLHCCTLVLFDAIHSAISQGDVKWSPGFHIFLLVMGRFLITASVPSYWVMNYSLAYMVYAIALMQELVKRFLPTLSKREAGEQAFSGKTEPDVKNPDIAGSPLFCLGSLTFCFVSLLLVVAFAGPKSLPITDINVFNDLWPTYIFGMVAFLSIVVGGLVSSTSRALYLQSHGLLRGFARDSYIFDPKYRLPMLLAIFSEISIICSGVLLFGATENPSIMVAAIFLPPIGGCLGHTYNTWVQNDYDLVVWPPVEKKNKNIDDAPSELEVAFHMMDNMFGDVDNQNDMDIEDAPETEVHVPQKTLKGFELPSMDVSTDLKDSTIKMPALPLKSALRKKRSAMGIATSGTPLVDLKVREGADSDKFGSGEGVIETDDPWAQFADEENEEDGEDASLVKKVKKKKKESSGERQGFMKHPCIVGFKEGFVANPVGKVIAQYLTNCFQFIKDRTKKSKKIQPVKKYDPDDPEGEKDSDRDEEEGEGEGAKQMEDDLDVDGEKDVLENDDDGPVKLEDMKFWAAVRGGYLTREEYIALGAWYTGLLLIMLMGIILSKIMYPEFMGHLLWVGVIIVMFTFIPIVKYFNTYVIDETMKQFAVSACVIHFLFSICFFAAALDADIGIEASLWTLDWFFYYPVFVYLVIEGYTWRDQGYIIEKLDKDGDGDVTWEEYFEYFKFYPIIVILFILFVFQSYVWFGSLVGNLALLLFLAAGTFFIFVRDWAQNNFYLSEELTAIADKILTFILVITGLTSLFYPENPVFPLSVFFFTLLLKQGARIVARMMVAEPNTIIYISPYIMPIYSYDSRSNDLVEENLVAQRIIIFLVTGAIWGGCMATLLHPVSIGVGIATIFLMSIAAILATAVSHVPLQLGRLVFMMSPDVLVEAVKAASENFHERKKPLQTEIENFDAQMDFLDIDAQSVEAKRASAISLAAELIEDTRSLGYIRDDTKAKVIDIDDEEEEVILPWYKQYWLVITTQWGHFQQAIMPVDKLKGYKRHGESILTFSDMVAQSLLTGKGPYGFFGLDGLWYSLFKYAQTKPYLKFLQQPWLNKYDEFGNLTTLAQLGDSFDAVATLNRLVEVDELVDEALHEEIRAGILFISMITVAADAKLNREQILFQKFLRENRFRLASNGITPPSDIFASSSFASINIPLVAVWLSTLSQEERERFHMLKATFSEEQLLRDEAIDNEDYQHAIAAKDLAAEREGRDQEMFQSIQHDISLRQAERVRALIEHLTPAEKQVFVNYKDEWIGNADCAVLPEYAELYEKFRTAVMHDENESTEYARQVLGDIEAARRDCRIGDYGRSYQFVDPEFPPGDAAVGNCSAVPSLTGWRCSVGISDTVQLFDDGTDPDDVEIGYFKTNWLLSAISMVAAAGGVGDGGVDEQVLNLFIGRFGIDGQLSFHTEVGAYCIRLHKSGIWIPLLVDDILPILQDHKWSNENKGVATAHSKEMNELWVTMLEKAFAKYYGSYAAIERGFVHQALEDMTGCEGECLNLAGYARGPKKRALWHTMLRYRANGYILGAGTGASTLADKGILEMGIVFDAAYTIYEVVQIDGHQLIKLRNPPGDHEEWKGDWSDKSELWNRRIKAKLGWTDADDNTFWMAFDDFCNVFRDLYICKWYNENKWKRLRFAGKWKKAEKRTEENDDEEYGEFKKPKSNHPDTTGGLPSKHNPGCVLENNPYYSLHIERPTDLRLTLTQADSRGVSSGDPVPAAIYICNSPHANVPLRLKTLERDDVVAYSGTARSDRTIHLYASLNPGLYVVLAGTYISEMESNFTLTLLTNWKTPMKQIWPPAWLKEGQEFNPNSLLGVDDTIQKAQREKAKKVGEKISQGWRDFIGKGGNVESDDSSDEDVEGGEDDAAKTDAEYKKIVDAL